MDDSMFMVEEIRDFVRQKIESIRATSPGEGWEEYYRGRLSAFEYVAALLNIILK